MYTHIFDVVNWSIIFQAAIVLLLSNYVVAISNTRYEPFYCHRCVSSLSGAKTSKLHRPLRVKDGKNICKINCIKMYGIYF